MEYIDIFSSQNENYKVGELVLLRDQLRFLKVYKVSRVIGWTYVCISPERDNFTDCKIFRHENLVKFDVEKLELYMKDVFEKCDKVLKK